MIMLQHGRCRVRQGARDFFVSAQNVQIQSGAHRAPLQCVLVFFIGGWQGAGVCSWPQTSAKCQGYELVELYLYSPYVFMTYRRKTLPSLCTKCLFLYFSAFVCILIILGCYFKIFNTSSAVSSGRLHTCSVSPFLWTVLHFGNRTIEQRFTTGIIYSADTRYRCCAVSIVT